MSSQRDGGRERGPSLHCDFDLRLVVLCFVATSQTVQSVEYCLFRAVRSAAVCVHRNGFGNRVEFRYSVRL